MGDCKGRIPSPEEERGEAAIVEDARGLLCPIPVLKLAERVARAAPGELVSLLADDPAAEEDVRLWCRGQGHKLEGIERSGTELRLTVRRR